MKNHRLTTLFTLSLGACSDVEDHDHDHDHDHGVTTTVIMNFAPQGGGDALSFSWSDPENDGGPVIDAIMLVTGTTYDLTVQLWNDLEDPAEEVTPEVEEGGTEHQLFFTGDAVQGPATGTNDDAVIEHAYADEDADGLPLGLANTMTALDAGSGTLTVTLRHMPPENGEAVKVADLAQTVAVDGFSAIGGDDDIRIDFTVSVE